MKYLFFNLKTTIFRVLEWFQVLFRYYWRNIRFVGCDLLLGIQYLGHNPHTISKRFLVRRGDRDVYMYGETPLTTLDQIVRRCRILSNDVVYELGCGPGRTLFWLNQMVKCRVIGIDYVPAFHSRALRVKKWLQLGEIEFRQEDMLTSDLSGATVIYLYGTCYDDATIAALEKKFDKLNEGTKVISVSYPLSSSQYRLVDSFPVRFPWGETDVFLNLKT